MFVIECYVIPQKLTVPGECGLRGVNVLSAAEAGVEPATVNAVSLLLVTADKIVPETKPKRNNVLNFNVQLSVISTFCCLTFSKLHIKKLC